MEEEEFFKKVYINPGEIDKDVVLLESKVPDKRTKEHSDWKKKINHLYGLYNSAVKFKCYKLI